MKKGQSVLSQLVLKKIEDKQEEIDLLIEENKNIEIKTIPKDKINNYFKKGFNKIKLSKTDYLILRNYTGFNFKGINGLLRNKWNSKFNGQLNEEKKYRFRSNADNISYLIKKFPKNRKAFKVYRGVTIDAFKDYGIEKIKDLKYLKDHYIYEPGFTSTSLLRDTSYFDKEVDGKLYNIEMEIIVPKDSQDGMPLTGYELSFSPGQNEYVFDRESLTKIIDVKIKNDYAYLKGILIPKKMYEKGITKDEKTNGRHG